MQEIIDKSISEILKEPLTLEEKRKKYIEFVLAQVKNCLIAKYLKEDNLPIEVIENLYIGSVGVAFSKQNLLDVGISHIICAASGIKIAFPENFTYKIINIQDSLSENINNYFEECGIFINECLSQNKKCLVHCFAGKSRSVSILIAFLIKYKDLRRDEALNLIKSKRKQAMPNSGFMDQLLEYEKLYIKNSTEKKIEDQVEEKKNEELIVPMNFPDHEPPMICFLCNRILNSSDSINFECCPISPYYCIGCMKIEAKGDYKCPYCNYLFLSIQIKRMIDKVIGKQSKVKDNFSVHNNINQRNTHVPIPKNWNNSGFKKTNCGFYFNQEEQNNFFNYQQNNNSFECNNFNKYNNEYNNFNYQNNFDHLFDNSINEMNSYSQNCFNSYNKNRTEMEVENINYLDNNIPNFQNQRNFMMSQNNFFNNGYSPNKFYNQNQNNNNRMNNFNRNINNFQFEYNYNEREDLEHRLNCLTVSNQQTDDYSETNNRDAFLNMNLYFSEMGIQNSNGSFARYCHTNQNPINNQNLENQRNYLPNYKFGDNSFFPPKNNINNENVQKNSKNIDRKFIRRQSEYKLNKRRNSRAQSIDHNDEINIGRNDHCRSISPIERSFINRSLQNKYGSLKPNTINFNNYSHQESDFFSRIQENVNQYQTFADLALSSQRN